MDHAYHLPVYFLMLSFQVTFIRMEREVSGTQGLTQPSPVKGVRGAGKREASEPPSIPHTLCISLM